MRVNWPGILGQVEAQIESSGYWEANMDSNGSGRRLFLKQAAALAGVAAGAGVGATKAEGPAQDAHVHINPSRRGARI